MSLHFFFCHFVQVLAVKTNITITVLILPYYLSSFVHTGCCCHMTKVGKLPFSVFVVLLFTLQLNHGIKCFRFCFSRSCKRLSVSNVVNLDVGKKKKKKQPQPGLLIPSRHVLDMVRLSPCLLGTLLARGSAA